MYRLPLLRLNVVREGSVPAETRTIANPRDAAAIAQLLIGDADREHVLALLLDTRHRVVGVHTVAVGDLNTCPLHPREVFKCALLCNAAAVILCHNHPSGDLQPSRADVAITRRLAEAGGLVGIAVLDHIIVAGGGYTSLRERGILEVPPP